MNRLEISCEAPVEGASMVTTILYPLTSCTSTPSMAAKRPRHLVHRFRPRLHHQ